MQWAWHIIRDFQVFFLELSMLSQLLFVIPFTYPLACQVQDNFRQIIRQAGSSHQKRG